MEVCSYAGDSGTPGIPGNGPLYKWANFDEIGDAADPDYRDTSGSLTYTTEVSEVTDIQDFARLLFQGPLNFPEWYYAARLGLDMSAAAAPFSTRYGLNYLHRDKAASLPVIQFLASEIEGYDHIDVLCAATDRPQRRKNEVFEPLLQFLLENSRAARFQSNGAGRAVYLPSPFMTDCSTAHSSATLYGLASTPLKPYFL